MTIERETWRDCPYYQGRQVGDESYGWCAFTEKECPAEYGTRCDQWEQERVEMEADEKANVG